MEGPRPSPPCVLWHTPRARPPGALLDALRRRGIEPTAEVGPFSALARLLRLSNAAPEVRPVLVLVEPATLPGWEHVVAAAARYAPASVCWAFRNGNPDSLSVVEAPRPRAVTPIDPGPARRPVVPLRLSGGGPVRADAPPAANGEESTPAPESMPNARTLLTEEELAMLLADDSSGDARRGR